MTRLAEPANRTARPNAGYLTRHLQRARRGADLDLITAVFIVVVVALIAIGIAGTAPIATGATLLALLPTTLVDLRTSRLPNRGLLAAVIVGGTAGAVEAAFGTRLDDVTALGLAGGALAVATPLLVLHLTSPASMGFGDVKLGAVLGAALAPLDPLAGLIAVALGSALAALTALAARRRMIPLGPGLLTGAALATVITPSVVMR